MTQGQTNTWKCSNCTFENSHTNLKCNICGYLPLNKISESLQTWDCNDCTFDDNGENIKCEMCGAYKSQIIEIDVDNLYSQYSRYSNPNLSDNESIVMLPLSPSKNQYIHINNDDIDKNSDDDISYNEAIKDNHNSDYINIWDKFKKRLLIKRVILIISYLTAFGIQLFLDTFVFWIYFPVILGLMLLMMSIISIYTKMNQFLCVQHWLLRSICHLLFRCLNIIISLEPLICIGYHSNHNQYIFYSMCSFILIHFITTFCIDWIIYDENTFIVSAFKMFLFLPERFNYKLNNDGSWTNPMQNVKCLINTSIIHPIGIYQILILIFHIIGIIGTYSMCLLL